MSKIKTQFFSKIIAKIDPPMSITQQVFTSKTGTKKSHHNHENTPSPRGRLLLNDFIKYMINLNR